MIRAIGDLAALAIVLVLVLPVERQQSGQSPPPDGTRIYRNLEYVKNGHERQRLDLYLPAKIDSPCPMIVWVHGGAWWTGSKDSSATLPFVTTFVAKGYAVASVNYRLSQQEKFPAQIEDCKAALRWLRANAKMYGLDPNRFAAWGASAGGHLVALLGTSSGVRELEGPGGNADQSSRVQAVVDWFGPTDFLQMDSHRLPDGLVHDEPNSPESQLIGGAIQENRAKVARANPITYVTPDDPPFLIMHGDRDLLVPHHQSQILVEALTKARVEVTFRTLEGAGHGGQAFTTEEVHRLVLNFLNRCLKPPQH